MKRTNLLLVCGLAAAISSPAMAQTGNQPGQRPGQQPGQQPGTQPGQDRDQDRQDRQTRLGGQQDAASIIRGLEGSWHIEIKMDPSLFGAEGIGGDRPGVRPGQRPGQPGQPGQERDLDPTGDRDDPTRRDQTDPTQRDQDDPTRPGQARPGQDRDQPGQPGQRDRALGADREGMITSRGYSQSRLVLNDKVLHEAAVIIISGEGARGAGAAAGQTGSDQIQVLSFIGFDDQSDDYSFVMMTDRSGKFSCSHGNFDASSRQLTFEKEGQGMRTGQARTGQTGSKLHGVKVVLELVSNDEYKVTMYDTSAAGATPGMREREQREGQEDRTPGVGAGSRQQDQARPGQQQKGKVVYEATYTRADGEIPGVDRSLPPGQQRPGQTPGQRPGQDRPGGGN